MKFVGFNNREYNVRLDKYIIKPNDTTKKSQYHLKTRELLHQMFAGYSILEEVKLPGSRKPHLKSVLFLDFFIPNQTPQRSFNILPGSLSLEVPLGRTPSKFGQK